MTTTMREALDQAMHQSGGGDAVQHLADSGIAVADVDTMSQAIHDVYCGITADHQHPNEKDRDQARAMMAAIQKVATSQPTA